MPPSKCSLTLLKSAVHQGSHTHELYFPPHRFPKQGENSSICNANFVELHPYLSRTGRLSFHQCSFYSGSWLPGNLIYHRRHLLVLMIGDHRPCVLYGGSDGSCMRLTVGCSTVSSSLSFPSTYHYNFFPTWTLSSGLQVVTNSFNYGASINAKETSDYNTVMQIKKNPHGLSEVTYISVPGMRFLLAFSPTLKWQQCSHTCQKLSWKLSGYLQDN